MDFSQLQFTNEQCSIFQKALGGHDLSNIKTFDQLGNVFQYLYRRRRSVSDESLQEISRITRDLSDQLQSVLTNPGFQKRNSNSKFRRDESDFSVDGYKAVEIGKECGLETTLQATDGSGTGNGGDVVILASSFTLIN
eukprot:Pgem_evm1s19171